MTGEVAELVLSDNYLQTQTITVTHRLGARLLDRTARYIRVLERARRLDRQIEFLPDDETLAERAQRGQGRCASGSPTRSPATACGARSSPR